MLSLARRKSQSGFSMIEVMVAMLIVAIGILGIAGLQVLSLRMNQSALLRTEALQLGRDMIDRMRANKTQDYAPVLLTGAPATATNCVVNACATDELAVYDVTQWKCAINSTQDPADGSQFAACATLGIAGSLPQGAGAIERVGEVYQVTVEWRDNRAGARASVVLRAQAEGI